MQKFAISRLNLVKKDTFRQHIPFLVMIIFIYGSNIRKIRLNFHYFEPKTTFLNEELSRIARNAKAPCRKVYVSRENCRLSGYTEMLSFKKRTIPPCKTSHIQRLSLFSHDGPSFRNAIVSPDIPSGVLVLNESSGRSDAIKPVTSCYFGRFISKQGLDII